MKKWFGVLTVILTLAAAHPGPARAMIMLDVFRDGYVEDYEPSGVLDGLPDRISDTNALLAAKIVVSSGAAIESRPVMTFDVGAYAGMTLSSAKLTGYGTRVDLQTPPLDPADSIAGHFSVYAGDGLVGLDDFNAPAASAGSVTFTPSQPFDLDPFDVDVKSALQTLFNSSASYAEFRVQSDGYTAFINAGETDSGSNFILDGRWPGPRLWLELAPSQNIVPEPSTMLLLGVGLLGIYYRRRNIKK